MPSIARRTRPCNSSPRLPNTFGHDARAFHSVLSRFSSPRFSHPIFALKPVIDSSGLVRRPKNLIFDKAVSNLYQQTAKHFAKTINKLKDQVTMLFISHQIPRGLQVDAVFSFGSDNQHTTQVGVVGEEK